MALRIIARIRSGPMASIGLGRPLQRRTALMRKGQTITEVISGHVAVVVGWYSDRGRHHTGRTD